jgi:hypothetical protein
MGRFRNFYLTETMTVLKQNMAKVLGLTHAAYNTWHDKSGARYIWNIEKNHFEKFDHQLDMNLNVKEKVKLSPKNDAAKERLSGEMYSVYEVHEKGNSISWLGGQKGYKLRSTDSSKPIHMLFIKASNTDEYYKMEKI